MAASQHQWLIYAISSGACAAINGVFAKLTTTSLTSTFAASLSHLFGLEHSRFFELLVRASCFGLNLLFDAIMWGLFTRALTLASSTVHVSVLNTSTNFLVAAMAGLFVFGERLPGLWWVGAGLLVAGCLMIGRREKGLDGEGVGHGAGAGGAVDVPGGSGGGLGEEYRDRDVGRGAGVEQEAIGLDKLDEPDDPLPKARNRSPYRDSVELKEREIQSARDGAL